jgi:hypothetical protein
MTLERGDADNSEVVAGGHDAAGLRAAFPAALGSSVDAVIAVMPQPQHPLTKTDLRALVGDEELAVLGRLYVLEPTTAASKLTPIQRLILSALYSRHHDGFVRQRHVRQLLDVDHAWIPPFVILLLGEYVVQVGQLIADRVADLPRQTYIDFARANPAFMRVVRSRVVSYWWGYYGHVPLREYAGYRALHDLGIWDGPEGRRWLPRPRPEPPARTR